MTIPPPKTIIYLFNSLFDGLNKIKKTNKKTTEALDLDREGRSKSGNSDYIQDFYRLFKNKDLIIPDVFYKELNLITSENLAWQEFTNSLRQHWVLSILNKVVPKIHNYFDKMIELSHFHENNNSLHLLSEKIESLELKESLGFAIQVTSNCHLLYWVKLTKISKLIPIKVKEISCKPKINGVFNQLSNKTEEKLNYGNLLDLFFLNCQSTLKQANKEIDMIKLSTDYDKNQISTFEIFINALLENVSGSYSPEHLDEVFTSFINEIKINVIYLQVSKVETDNKYDKLQDEMLKLCCLHFNLKDSLSSPCKFQYLVSKNAFVFDNQLMSIKAVSSTVSNEVLNELDSGFNDGVVFFIVLKTIRRLWRCFLRVVDFLIIALGILSII